MKIPIDIQFKSNCEEILRKTLLSVYPEEGCALLIGKQKESNLLKNRFLYQISLIWPCCNIWEQEKYIFNESKNLTNQERNNLSRRNRFAIDPREQLLAQKWARSRGLVILGTAHSHPSNLSIPSKADISWNFSPSLMVILNSKGELRAWWVNNAASKKAIEVPVNLHDQDA